MAILSVALVTRNRPESLNRCLESLRRQSIQPYEIVISDDSEPDRVHEIQEVANRWDCRYVAGPRQGLYANRNYAALACKGTHIRTMDDDHLFPPGHMEQCLEAVQSDPKSIWTTGEVLFIEGKYHEGTLTAGQLAPSGVSESVKDVNDNWAIADGSTIYPSEVFSQGHRMVEWFNYGSSYLEFGAYLYQCGFKSRCIMGAIVEHHPLDTSIFNRNYTPKVLESALFSCLCYNLYFKPNLLLVMRYVPPKLVRAKFEMGIQKTLSLSLERSKERWMTNSQLSEAFNSQFIHQDSK